MQGGRSTAAAYVSRGADGRSTPGGIVGMLEDGEKGEKGEDWEDEPCQEKRGRNWRRVQPASFC